MQHYSTDIPMSIPFPTMLEAVGSAYSQASGAIGNQSLYRAVADHLRMSPTDFHRREPVGVAGVPRSKVARSARWAQQTLRAAGLIERVQGRRGEWRMTSLGRQRLTRLDPGLQMVAFSTGLGIAIWADYRDAARNLPGSIRLGVTSPPYALAAPRAYGNPSAEEYVDWLTGGIELILPSLAAGASLVINIGNATFLRGSPARQLLQERLTLALVDRLGLSLMDRLVWENTSAPPGPIAWASKRRVHLSNCYEPCLWFSNDPSRVRSNNQRVLQPHTEQHQRLMAQGGERRQATYSDGAYRIRPGSFGRPTEGRIPRNVLRISGSCHSQRAYKRAAIAAGLPAHGAPFPLALAAFLLEFMSDAGDLTLDFMAGSLTFALAAERARRQWVAIELYGEYLAGSALRFESPRYNPAFLQAIRQARPGFIAPCPERTPS